MADPHKPTKPEQRTFHLSASIYRTDAPANSPAGGGGHGNFTSRLPYGKPAVSALHRTTGAEHGFIYNFASSVSDEWDGVLCVYRAQALAQLYVPQAVLEETGQAIRDVIKGLIPGLLMSAAVVGLTTVAGAVIGGLLGSLAGGVGAIPGAAVGAEAGLDVGMFLLTWIGVGFLIKQIGESIGEVTTLTIEGIRLAWGARGKPEPARQSGIEAGAHRMAKGVAVFFRVILEGIVLYVVGKGAIASTERVASLVAQLRRSKLGVGFAEWVEANIGKLIKDPRTNPNLRMRSPGGAPEVVPEKPPTPKPKPAEKPPAKKPPSTKLRNKYQKRTPEEVEKLRKEFDGKNGARSKFVKDYADSPEAARRFTPEQLDKMKKTGQTPKGWVVHHKQPLFRGGTNEPSNFRVMKDTFHRTNSKKLHYYPEGKNPYGRN